MKNNINQKLKATLTGSDNPKEEYIMYLIFGIPIFYFRGSWVQWIASKLMTYNSGDEK